MVKIRMILKRGAGRVRKEGKAGGGGRRAREGEGRLGEERRGKGERGSL